MDGTTAPAGGAAASTAPTTSGANGTGTLPVGGTQPAAQPTTFSQSDVDRIVSERLARERTKYADYDDLKTKATKFDEIEAQNATELDKAVKKADADARADMLTTTNTRLVRAEVKAAAAAAQFHDPADAAALLDKRFGEVKVNDHGEVDDAAVRALVDELAKAKPHLVKAANGSSKPLPGQGTTPSGSVSGKDAGLAEARKRFGDPSKTT